MNKLFFDSWASFERTLIITVLAYIAMILLLQISGKRTLSKMNAFDFIITVALGSAFATVALTKSVALIDGVLVFALLIGMQFIITWLSVRVKAVKHLITSRPTLLLYKGELLKQVAKKERVTIDEIYVAVRKKGIADLKDVAAIVLDTTGDLTVIPNMELDNAQTLKSISNYPDVQKIIRKSISSVTASCSKRLLLPRGHSYLFAYCVAINTSATFLKDRLLYTCNTPILESTAK